MSDAIDRMRMRKAGIETIDDIDVFGVAQPSLFKSSFDSPAYMPSLSSTPETPSYTPSYASQIQLRAPEGVEPVSTAPGYQLRDPSKMFQVPTYAPPVPVVQQEPGFFSKKVPGINIPVWQLMLGVVGVGAIGFGVYKLMNDRPAYRAYSGA